MVQKGFLILLGFLIACANSTAIPVSAFQRAPAPKYLRVFYYQDNAHARESLFTHAQFIDVFAPQTYAFDSSGTLSGGIREAVLAFVKKRGIKIMPLVTNSNFSQKAYRTILTDQTKQDAAIDALVVEAEKQGYWGWQIDFEQMDASYQGQFSSFVKKTADAMHAHGLSLSVAVIAQVSNNPSDYPNNLWQQTIGVYDYQALAAAADFISLMSYDDPSSKGPVVGYAWLKRVIEYSMKLIPHDKLSLGIPLYYWQWNDATGKRVGIGGRNGIYAVFKKHKVSVHYSVEEEAPYLTYFNHARSYTIWYENAQSVKKKIDLITQHRLHGFSAWALGLELPGVYGAI